MLDPMIPRPFRVLRRRRELADTFTLELEADDGAPFEFQPGQFTMLYVFGAGEAPISISGDPAKGSLVHTIRAVGTVTDRLMALKPGDHVGVRGHFGAPWPVEKARGHDVLIIAGGVGLAPLRPSIYHILANRQDYGRVAILYGARTPKDILFEKDLVKWRSRFDIYVDVTVDRAEAGWQGKIGVVPKLIDRQVHRFDPESSVALICGPEVMMRFTVAKLRECGVPDAQQNVSMERNMHCAVGLCGHCQLGPEFICKDGPVFPFDRIAPVFHAREL